MDLRTIGISIERPLDAVYEYLATPEKYSEWSFFLTTARPDGEQWIFETPNGPVRVRFVERNAYGVLDHWVTVAGNATIYVPFRVVAHGQGSAVIFTVIRQPEMSDQSFDADVAAVRKDLENLKRVLESA